ncbi:universal stress protein [Aneurinibacillus sp. Ricciae_BoGa-3]|uniref:universal stress protein n=1 Tax=Aneurinibacillus sp. Ricciae_BoGa-3 TaxID=3022697 RepID=UPI0023419E5D|nr:universal stress protein [Aneurinibacillus sp. Ricciae_BoGa-3]WCK54936.1 universal stress protein [Aneurinibacillus sp. Ricciae_BoGa-3]
MARDILVPTDGSAHADHALITAIGMAQAFKEKIILLNVQPDFTAIHTERFVSDDEIKEYEADKSQEEIGQADKILKQSGVNYTVKTRFGGPKEEIIEEARDSAVRCIVMGSRGLGGVLGSVLGSVSNGVVREAPCPVMIVPKD